MWTAAVSRRVAVSTVNTAVAKSAAAKAAWFNQRRCYRSFRGQKSAEFWRRKVEFDSCNPRRLWNTIDTILGHGKVPTIAVIDVNLFDRFFAGKVVKVRLVTDSALPPTFSTVRHGMSLAAFKQLTHLRHHGRHWETSGQITRCRPPS